MEYGNIISESREQKMMEKIIFCNTHATSIVILGGGILNKPQNQDILRLSKFFNNQNATLIDLKMVINQRGNI